MNFSESITITHKIDPVQFAALTNLATLLLNLLGTAIDGADPAVLADLTEKLKASSDALATAVKANQPKP